MPKKPSSAPVKKPVAKKAVRKTVVKKKTAVKKATARKTAVEKIDAEKSAAENPETKKRPRATVLNEPPGILVADARDHAAIDAINRAHATASAPVRVSNRRSAVDRLNDPPPDQSAAASMVERVSDAIERELSKIEQIVGSRMVPAQRIEAESRARVLASLARTLKEVMRLREQQRAGDDTTKADDDDAVPRDLDEFRRELSRRLEGMVAGRAPLPSGGDDAG
ncbi:MAG TPA: hypothetical protein VF467_11320 [Afipia sp.]